MNAYEALQQFVDEAYYEDEIHEEELNSKIRDGQAEVKPIDGDTFAIRDENGNEIPVRSPSVDTAETVPLQQDKLTDPEKIVKTGYEDLEKKVLDNYVIDGVVLERDENGNPVRDKYGRLLGETMAYSKDYTEYVAISDVMKREKLAVDINDPESAKDVRQLTEIGKLQAQSKAENLLLMKEDREYQSPKNVQSIGEKSLQKYTELLDYNLAQGQIGIDDYKKLLKDGQKMISDMYVAKSAFTRDELRSKYSGGFDDVESFVGAVKESYSKLGGKLGRQTANQLFGDDIMKFATEYFEPVEYQKGKNKTTFWTIKKDADINTADAIKLSKALEKATGQEFSARSKMKSTYDITDIVTKKELDVDEQRAYALIADRSKGRSLYDAMLGDSSFKEYIRDEDSANSQKYKSYSKTAKEITDVAEYYGISRNKTIKAMSVIQAVNEGDISKEKPVVLDYTDAGGARRKKSFTNEEELNSFLENGAGGDKALSKAINVVNSYLNNPYKTSADRWDAMERGLSGIGTGIGNVLINDTTKGMAKSLKNQLDIVWDTVTFDDEGLKQDTEELRRANAQIEQGIKNAYEKGIEGYANDIKKYFNDKIMNNETEGVKDLVNKEYIDYLDKNGATFARKATALESLGDFARSTESLLLLIDEDILPESEKKKITTSALHSAVAGTTTGGIATNLGLGAVGFMSGASMTRRMLGDSVKSKLVKESLTNAGANTITGGIAFLRGDFNPDIIAGKGGADERFKEISPEAVGGMFAFNAVVQGGQLMFKGAETAVKAKTDAKVASTPDTMAFKTRDDILAKTSKEFKEYTKQFDPKVVDTANQELAKVIDLGREENAVYASAMASMSDAIEKSELSRDGKTLGEVLATAKIMNGMYDSVKKSDAYTPEVKDVMLKALESKSHALAMQVEDLKQSSHGEHDIPFELGDGKTITLKELEKSTFKEGTVSDIGKRKIADEHRNLIKQNGEKYKFIVPEDDTTDVVVRRNTEVDTTNRLYDTEIVDDVLEGHRRAENQVLLLEYSPTREEIKSDVGQGLEIEQKLIKGEETPAIQEINQVATSAMHEEGGIEFDAGSFKLSIEEDLKAFKDKTHGIINNFFDKHTVSKDRTQYKLKEGASKAEIEKAFKDAKIQMPTSIRSFLRKDTDKFTLWHNQEDDILFAGQKIDDFTAGKLVSNVLKSSTMSVNTLLSNKLAQRLVQDGEINLDRVHRIGSNGDHYRGGDIVFEVNHPDGKKLMNAEEVLKYAFTKYGKQEGEKKIHPDRYANDFILGDILKVKRRASTKTYKDFDAKGAKRHYSNNKSKHIEDVVHENKKDWKIDFTNRQDVEDFLRFTLKTDDIPELYQGKDGRWMIDKYKGAEDHYGRSDTRIFTFIQEAGHDISRAIKEYRDHVLGDDRTTQSIKRAEKAKTVKPKPKSKQQSNKERRPNKEYFHSKKTLKERLQNKDNKDSFRSYISEGISRILQGQGIIKSSIETAVSKSAKVIHEQIFKNLEVENGLTIRNTRKFFKNGDRSYNGYGLRYAYAIKSLEKDFEIDYKTGSNRISYVDKDGNPVNEKFKDTEIRKDEEVLQGTWDSTSLGVASNFDIDLKAGKVQADYVIFAESVFDAWSYIALNGLENSKYVIFDGTGLNLAKWNKDSLTSLTGKVDEAGTAEIHLLHDKIKGDKDTNTKAYNEKTEKLFDYAFKDRYDIYEANTGKDFKDELIAQIEKEKAEEKKVHDKQVEEIKSEKKLTDYFTDANIDMVAHLENVVEKLKEITGKDVTDLFFDKNGLRTGEKSHFSYLRNTPKIVIGKGENKAEMALHEIAHAMIESKDFYENTTFRNFASDLGESMQKLVDGNDPAIQKLKSIVESAKNETDTPEYIGREIIATIFTDNDLLRYFDKVDVIEKDGRFTFEYNAKAKSNVSEGDKTPFITRFVNFIKDFAVVIADKLRKGSASHELMTLTASIVNKGDGKYAELFSYDYKYASTYYANPTVRKINETLSKAYEQGKAFADIDSIRDIESVRHIPYNIASNVLSVMNDIVASKTNVNVKEISRKFLGEDITHTKINEYTVMLDNMRRDAGIAIKQFEKSIKEAYNRFDVDDRAFIDKLVSIDFSAIKPERRFDILNKIKTGDASSIKEHYNDALKNVKELAGSPAMFENIEKDINRVVSFLADRVNRGDMTNAGKISERYFKTLVDNNLMSKSDYNKITSAIDEAITIKATEKEFEKIREYFSDTNIKDAQEFFDLVESAKHFRDEGAIQKYKGLILSEDAHNKEVIAVHKNGYEKKDFPTFREVERKGDFVYLYRDKEELRTSRGLLHKPTDDLTGELKTYIDEEVANTIKERYQNEVANKNISPKQKKELAEKIAQEELGENVTVKMSSGYSSIRYIQTILPKEVQDKINQGDIVGSITNTMRMSLTKAMDEDIYSKIMQETNLAWNSKDFNPKDMAKRIKESLDRENDDELPMDLMFVFPDKVDGINYRGKFKSKYTKIDDSMRDFLPPEFRKAKYVRSSYYPKLVTFKNNLGFVKDTEQHYQLRKVLNWLADATDLFKESVVLLRAKSYLNNYVANNLILLNEGVAPNILRQAKNAKLLDEYNNLNVELQKAIVTKDKAKEQEILKKMKAHKFHKYDNIGFFSVLVDGIDTVEGKANNNKIRKLVNSIVDAGIRKAVKNDKIDDVRIRKLFGEAFASDDTFVRKWAIKTVRYVDLLARIDLYEHYIKNGMDEKEATNRAMKAFVDPRAKDTAFLSNLDTYGIVSFPRFMRNQMPYILTMAKEKPDILIGSYVLYGAMQDVTGVNYVSQDTATLLGTAKDAFDPRPVDFDAIAPYFHLS